jgi:hypothetical protein
VNWLENWARRERLFDETLPQDARGYVRLGFRQLDLGEESAAWRSFDEAVKRDPTTVELLRKRAQDLIAQGRPLYATNLLHYLPTHDGNSRGEASR